MAVAARRRPNPLPDPSRKQPPRWYAERHEFDDVPAARAREALTEVEGECRADPGSLTRASVAMANPRAVSSITATQPLRSRSGKSLSVERVAQAARRDPGQTAEATAANIGRSRTKTTTMPMHLQPEWRHRRGQCSGRGSRLAPRPLERAPNSTRIRRSLRRRSCRKAAASSRRPRASVIGPPEGEQVLIAARLL